MTQQERTLEQDVNDFIAAYYRSFVYDPINLPRFYETIATIWREGLGKREGVPYKEAESLLRPTIEEGSNICITDFNYSPCIDGFFLVVDGHISFNGVSKALHQTFYIINAEHHMAILTDSLTLAEPQQIFAEPEDLVEVRPPLKQQPKRKPAPQPKEKQQLKEKPHNPREKQHKRNQQNFIYVNPDAN